MPYIILVINPAATSTTVGLFSDLDLVAEATLTHNPSELAKKGGVWAQYPYRHAAVTGWLASAGVDPGSLAAAVGRGGLLGPVKSGTYLVNQRLLEALRRGEQGEHAANLGAPLAYGLLQPLGKPAYVVDPVSVDELWPLARLSGLPELPRVSLSHALSAKWAGRQAAAAFGGHYEEMDLVTVHLGAGISVVAHQRGQMVDLTNPLEEGAFSAERAGTLPTGEVIRLAFSGQYTERELVEKLVNEGGLKGYLGTADWAEVEARIVQGDPLARLVYEAMAYQIAKEVGAAAVALSGRAQAVVLTGPLASSELLLGWLRPRLAFVGPILVYPQAAELHALAAGAYQVLSGQASPRQYLA